MSKRKQTRKKNGCSRKQQNVAYGKGQAPAHAKLDDNLVHVFVDDQNLFWGIVNNAYGPGFRIDFGDLLVQAAKRSDGTPRGVGSAYVAGVIPDDDSFWRIAANKGFEVRRGYLGADSRSKQDDAYLITELTRTVCKASGISTVVLVAGDGDYGPPLEAALDEGWRTELAFISGNHISQALTPRLHEIRQIFPADIEYTG